MDGSEKKSKATTVIISIFTLSFIYAIVRYNIVRSVSYEEIPLYILNKSTSLSSVILIGLSFLYGPIARFLPSFSKHHHQRKALGVWGFGMAALHAVMSLILFSPSVYPRFFLESGKITFTGQLSMLTGALAFLIFCNVSISSIPSVEKELTPPDWKKIQRYGYLAYLLVLLHVGIMGWNGWFRPDSWQYGMASITFVSATFIFIVILFRLLVILFPQKTVK